MTHYSETNGKLSDEAIRFILTASDVWTNANLAARFGVGQDSVRQVRVRNSKRALRVARALGLLSPVSRASAWPAKRRGR